DSGRQSTPQYILITWEKRRGHFRRGRILNCAPRRTQAADFTLDGVIPVFRCMKTFRRRRAPQSAEAPQYFSVFCGALRRLFIHGRNFRLTAAKSRLNTVPAPSAGTDFDIDGS